MSKIDDILEVFWRFVEIDRAKEAIKQEVLEAIGEDESFQKGLVMGTPFNAMVLARNRYREELRKRIEDLFG